MTVLYVDVSHHDRNRRGKPLDWGQIRAATSPVMCARVSYGDPQGFSPSSPYAVEHLTGAKAAGYVLRGGYHNLIRGDQASIARQVDVFRRALDAGGANWAMLDVERYDELVKNGLWPRFDDVRRFVDRWRAVDKRVLAIYLPHWIWSGHIGKPDLRGIGPLVASNYGSNPKGAPSGVYAARGGDKGAGWAAYGGVTPRIWQYGSNINCPGASGTTDCNAFRGTLTQLQELLTGTGGSAGGKNEDGDMTRDQVKAAVLEALQELVPYQASGPKARLAATKPKPWSDLSVVGRLDYVMERAVGVGQESDAEQAFRQHVLAELAALRDRPAADVDYDRLADAILRRALSGQA